MNDDLKGKIIRSLHTKNLTTDHEMAAAADRQKLGKSLYKTQ
jgi:hypothetical protein